MHPWNLVAFRQAIGHLTKNWLVQKNMIMINFDCVLDKDIIIYIET